MFSNLVENILDRGQGGLNKFWDGHKLWDRKIVNGSNNVGASARCDFYVLQRTLRARRSAFTWKHFRALGFRLF